MEVQITVQCMVVNQVVKRQRIFHTHTAMRGLKKRTVSSEPQSLNLMNGNNKPNDDELNLIVGSGNPSPMRIFLSGWFHRVTGRMLLK
ncbi:hypothetical protein AVEN_167171-1 [Araneus ventricosus]|uniref:Uncharacterized protein n=1 Tax=Araneus ventricosus TaxID=182803 RepID=A0A4Y2G717_ARAVE|nr:hypothetical protein AVEN_167171-1 [Araneus ventricosus]